MVATVVVMFDFGGSDGSPGTQQDTSALGPPNIRFKDADDATINLTNALIIPAAGTKYSRWKSIYLKCTVAPDTQIDNVRFYTDGGGFGTGITVKVGNQFPVKNSGASTGYEVSDAEQELVAGHGGITTSTDAFTYTSGAPLSGPTISEAGSIINLANETTNYLLLQMEVGTTASPGNLADETFTFLYDEI